MNDNETLSVILALCFQVICRSLLMGTVHGDKVFVAKNRNSVDAARKSGGTANQTAVVSCATKNLPRYC